jgi:hypothetical protein
MMKGKKYQEENKTVQKRVQESKGMVIAIGLSGLLLIVLIGWRTALLIWHGLYHGHIHT